ncbi:hypothetical protein VTJ49DRAFT_6475 [Mycothermus thermophilus]|uniref:Chalcone/stilbene synthase N-terminal domain-containing protein n=1 Tax=Humicola insolens TaxID=85995 RepID=A0ABR3VLV2_HUMIN
MASQPEFKNLGLSILGIGSQYPPHSLKPESVDVLSKRFYPESPAMTKVLAINRYTGIDQRSSIGTPDHPLVNQPNPPTIKQLHDIFMSEGVPLAVSAARKALAEARLAPGDVTHMVSTTCTDSANPGYDHFVARELGLGLGVEKVLLHGVGCSGGLAALRTAAGLALGHSRLGRPARVLVVALEVSTTFVRSELDSVNENQETRIGVALFSDCAGALVLGNDIPLRKSEVVEAPPIYTLLGWHHNIIPDTDSDLGFDVDPMGWKVVLSPRVPGLAKTALRPAFDALLASVPPLRKTRDGKRQDEPTEGLQQLSKADSQKATNHPDEEDHNQSSYSKPSDFDWALHPGGAAILTGAESALGITPHHLRASYDTLRRGRGVGEEEDHDDEGDNRDVDARVDGAPNGVEVNGSEEGKEEQPREYVVAYVSRD